MKTIANILGAFRMHSIIAVLFAWLALSWSFVATAAILVSASPAPEIVLDPLVFAITCLISTLAGGTALAIRVNNRFMEGEGELVRPWMFAAAHMGGSWMAGTAGFLLGRANEWDIWKVLLGVLLLSFLGAKGIEMLAERWLGSVRIPGAEGKKT